MGKNVHLQKADNQGIESYRFCHSSYQLNPLLGNGMVWAKKRDGNVRIAHSRPGARGIWMQLVFHHALCIFCGTEKVGACREVAEVYFEFYVVYFEVFEETSV